MRSQKVKILSCAVAGIHYELAFLTGNKHTTENGTRHEIIAIDNAKKSLIRLWLITPQFEILKEG